MRTGPVSPVLDRLVLARLGSDFVVERHVEREVYSYAVAGPDLIGVTLGHSHGVHFWLDVLPGWRLDGLADDLESVVYEFNEVLDIAESVLRGKVLPPARGDRKRGERWKVPGFDVVMRRVVLD